MCFDLLRLRKAFCCPLVGSDEDEGRGKRREDRVWGELSVRARCVVSYTVERERVEGGTLWGGVTAQYGDCSMLPDCAALREVRKS